MRPVRVNLVLLLLLAALVYGLLSLGGTVTDWRPVRWDPREETRDG